MRGSDGSRDDECTDLRELVVRYRADIFGFARSFSRNDADAEDLAQSAALRALERGEALRDPTRAKLYLFRIVRNLATDQARRRARLTMEPWASVPEIVSTDAPVDEAVLRADDWALPRAAMAELPAAHQELLRMRFVEELDNATIAAQLGITEHAARQRVYRALQALRAAARARRLAS
jgi:RNA polymerase sigma-70 factor (ECF subfamily)